MRDALPLLLAAILAGCRPGSGPVGNRDGAVLFIGDSLTVELPVEAVVADARKAAVRGRTTAQLLRAMPSLQGASRVVLTIGTNDVKNRQMAGFEARVRRLSARIDVPLVWNGLPPGRNYDVTSANAIIRKVCSERSDCVFVPSRSTLADLRDDGVHLTPDGYARWAADLRAVL